MSLKSKSKSNYRKSKKNMKGGDPMSLDTKSQDWYEIEHPASVDFNSGCQDNTSVKMTPQSIPLYTTTSPDWHEAKQHAPLAVDLDVGINEYTFGRTTPDNKFVVSTGLVNNPQGVEMVGGKKPTTEKKKVKKLPSKKPTTEKKKVKKSPSKKPTTEKKKVKKPTTKKSESIINKVVSGSKNLFEKTKKAIIGDSSSEKKKVKKVKKEKKVKKDVKTKSFFNKITSGTKNIYEKIKKSIVGDEKKNSKKSKTTKSIKKGKTVKTLKK